MIYELTVTLRDIEPAIWRVVQVPAGITLGGLHRVLQVAMGWTNSHRYLFHVGEKAYGEPDEEWDIEVLDSAVVTLPEAAQQHPSFVYEYDLGDSWEHDIVVQRRVPGASNHLPKCLGGARACPPEDAGGSGGYEELIEALSDPNHEEHDAMVMWAGEDFDPERFDRPAVNRRLRGFILPFS